MVYDTVILSKEIIVEEKKKRAQIKNTNLLYFHLLEDYKSLLDRMKSERNKNTEGDGAIWQEGILLDICKNDNILTLQALCSKDRVEQIHSKRIVLKSYSANTNSKEVSMYELLWAAGVKIDSVTLKPILTREHETSIPGVYYYEQPCAI